jgi:hypothetical protein
MQDQTTAIIVSQWLPLWPGYLKCNVDASFYDAAGAIGWGWYLRDHRERFVLAGANLIHGRVGMLEGEAITLKESK